MTLPAPWSDEDDDPPASTVATEVFPDMIFLSGLFFLGQYLQLKQNSFNLLSFITLAIIWKADCSNCSINIMVRNTRGEFKMLPHVLLKKRHLSFPLFVSTLPFNPINTFFFPHLVLFLHLSPLLLSLLPLLFGLRGDPLRWVNSYISIHSFLMGPCFPE